MFDRIVVNVVEMMSKISLVADGMLPVALLPDATAASLLSPDTYSLFNATCRQPLGGECPLERRQPTRIILVAARQGPEHVKMIKEQNHRLHFERPPSSTTGYGLMQLVARTALGE